MKTPQTLFAIAAALMLVAPVVVHAADVSATSKTEYKQGDDGSYESSKTSVKEDASGTVSKDESSVDVDKDKDGSMKKTVEHKSTTDPKGLMNKSTTKTKDTVTTNKDKNEYTHKKEVNGDTVEDEKTTEEKQ